MKRRRREIERPAKLTVERLSADRLDIRELKRCGLLQDDRMSLSALFRWPQVSRIIGSRYRLEVEFGERQTTQRIRVSWTRCHLGGRRPWMHCPYCDERVAILLGAHLGGYRCRDCGGRHFMPAKPRAPTAAGISRFARSGCSSTVTRHSWNHFPIDQDGCTEKHMNE
jgi:DNA-directed RNA polymerase subunit RPC12/RpoP